MSFSIVPLLIHTWFQPGGQTKTSNPANRLNGFVPAAKPLKRLMVTASGCAVTRLKPGVNEKVYRQFLGAPLMGQILFNANLMLLESRRQFSLRYFGS